MAADAAVREEAVRQVLARGREAVAAVEGRASALATESLTAGVEPEAVDAMLREL